MDKLKWTFKSIVMRLILPLLLLSASPALAAPPALKVFSEWQPGAWRAAMIGGRSSPPMCLADPEHLMTGARPQAGCNYTIIRDTANAATITYNCPGGRQGRTEIRRDAHNIYTIDAQGVANGLPFGDRAEWRRIGDCQN